MRYRMWGMLMLTVTAAACATAKAPVAPAQQVRIEVPPPQVHDPSPPLPTGADVLAEQPAEVRQAVARHQTKGRWPSYVTPGYVIYPFNPAATPLVECSPLRTTDIQLAAVWLFGFNNARSWDARYFGPVPLANVRGALEPLVTW